MWILRTSFPYRPLPAQISIEIEDDFVHSHSVRVVRGPILEKIPVGPMPFCGVLCSHGVDTPFGHELRYEPVSHLRICFEGVWYFPCLFYTAKQGRSSRPPSRSFLPLLTPSLHSPSPPPLPSLLTTPPSPTEQSSPPPPPAHIKPHTTLLPPHRPCYTVFEETKSIYSNFFRVPLRTVILEQFEEMPQSFPDVPRTPNDSPRELQETSRDIHHENAWEKKGLCQNRSILKIVLAQIFILRTHALSLTSNTILFLPLPYQCTELSLFRVLSHYILSLLHILSLPTAVTLHR